jgi:DNA polymerase I
MSPKRLVIIDGYSLLYRAFFATRYLSTADGRPTNALFGLTNMLFNLLENIKPDAIVVAFDAPGKTFRHAEYAEYKGTRREIQPELAAQLPVARELMAALGIPSVEATGYEADDVVGTISRLGEENGYNTTIVTGDLDALQLVDDCVSVLTMKMGVTDTVTYGPREVVERYGFGPEHIPDFKAIKGDTSDNIPGVPGIGDKGASDLIQRFGTIENMLARFDEIDPKYAKKMEPVKEQMVRSKWLATIKCDVPLTYDFKPFILTEEQMQKAKDMMQLLEFRSQAKRADKVFSRYIDGAAPASQHGLADGETAPDTAVVEVEMERIEVTLSSARNYGDLAKFVDDRKFAVYFAAAPVKADLFSEEVERKAFVAVGNKVVECSEADAAKLITDLPTLAVLHDSKPLYRRMLRQLPTGTPLPLLPTPGFDSLLAGYVLQSGRSSYALLDLVQGYLDAVPTKPEEMAGALYLLEGAMCDRLTKEGQLSILNDIELPLVPILAEMEHYGICADRDQLREFSKQLQVTIEQTTRNIYEMAGQEFTIGSPKQLGEVLFDKLQIPGAQKTKTGYATGAEILQLIAPTHPIAGEVLTWRELTKLKSTYADSLEKLIQEDGRIHTTYNQTVAATGRLSSIDPNLQNIPIRTELGRGIRKAFTADKGYKLASLDYSQIELRVLAHMCGEPALVEAFSQHEDVHTVTAQQMFGLGDDPPTKDQRRLSKMLNYAVLYGVSEFGLAQQLGGGFSIAEAKALITQYNERFPTVKEFTAGVVKEAKSKGFTTTMLGRRRYFPDIHTLKVQERRGVERQAMNAPIQGTAADMLKLAIIDVRKRIAGSETRMLLNVHDELVFEMKLGEEALIEPIREGMASALPLSVPIEVDAKIGDNWNDMTLVPAPVPV